MGPGEHRPHDEEYWTAPWSTALFAGDLFEAIPFGDQPTTLYRAEDGKHFVGEVGFAYGLLTTPTCDMAEQRGEGEAAHPFHVQARGLLGQNAGAATVGGRIPLPRAKPGTRLELVTPSLPWKCSTN
jgi:hypothetical protein